MRVPEIALIAPIFDVSGIAEAARNIYLSLFDLGVKVKIIEVPNWSHLKAEMHPEVRDKIRIGLDRNDIQQPVAIHFYPPDPFRGTMNINGAIFNVNWSLFETDKCPILWRDMLNDKKFVECWVAGEFNVEAYASQGVDRQKLRFMPLGVDVDRYRPDVEPLSIEGKKDGFTFMTAMDWSFRKNPEAMITAYLQEFNKVDDATFVIKAYTGYGDENSKNMIRQTINRLRAMTRSNAKIILITDFIHSDLMANFHKAADAWVNLSKGEGWDMGALQSMACGVPVIASDSTAHKMYLTEENGYPVSCRPLPINDAEFLAKSPQFIGHNWAEPSIKEARTLMKKAYEDSKTGALEEKGKRARETALDFTWKKAGVNTIFELGKYLS